MAGIGDRAQAAMVSGNKDDEVLTRLQKIGEVLQLNQDASHVSHGVASAKADVELWDNFYVPVQSTLGDTGLRLSVRQMANTKENQIYDLNESIMHNQEAALDRGVLPQTSFDTNSAMRYH